MDHYAIEAQKPECNRCGYDEALQDREETECELIANEQIGLPPLAWTVNCFKRS